jgi:hypothetical protein
MFYLKNKDKKSWHVPFKPCDSPYFFMGSWGDEKVLYQQKKYKKGSWKVRACISATGNEIFPRL